MFVSKKILSLVVLSLFLSPSIAQSSQAQKTAAAVAIIGADTALERSPEEFEAALDEFGDKVDAQLKSFNFPDWNPEIDEEMDQRGKAGLDNEQYITDLSESSLRKYNFVSGIVDGSFHATCMELVLEASQLDNERVKMIMHATDGEIILFLEECWFDIELIKYGLLFLDNLFDLRGDYFKLNETSRLLTKKYGQQLRALQRGVLVSTNPSYVNELAGDIKQLKELISHFNVRHYPVLEAEATTLLNNLNLICQILLNLLTI